MTSKDHLNSLREWMQEINKNKDLDIAEKKMNQETKAIFEKIYCLYYDASEKEHKKMLGDQLAQDNAGQVLTEYMKALSSSVINTPVVGHKADCLEIVRKVCWTYSDASLDFCLELGRAGLFPLIVTDLIKFQSELDDKTIRDSIVNPCIRILHNCVKQPENKKYFQEANSLEAILPYSKTELQGNGPQMTKMISTITLAYLIEEKDNAIISLDDSMIKFILLYLKHAIAAEYRDWQGFTDTFLFDGLMDLARTDENKVKIVNEGVLPLLVELLQNGSKSEKEASSNTVFFLSFSDLNKSKIREENNMMDVLKELSGRPCRAALSAKRALWVLDNEETTSKKKKKEGYKSASEKTTRLEDMSDSSDDDDDNVEDPNGQPISTATKRKSSPKHVMISYYERDYQELILKIKERLQKMNYCVWIDVESMRGPTIGAMAAAVENSAVVLMCFSSEYTDNPICRMEAEYAYKRATPVIPVRVEHAYEPDGWLGALEGTKFYFDFSKIKSFEDEFTKLIQELGDRGKRSADEDGEPMNTCSPSWLEDILYCLREFMQEINKNKDSDIAEKKMNQETKAIFEEIFWLRSEAAEREHEKMIGDQLAQDHAGQVLTEYIKALSSSATNTPVVGYKADCLEIVRMVCWNYSDASLDFCLQLGRAGLFPMLVADLIKFQSKLDDETIRDSIIDPCIGILHNCVKQPDNKKYFQEANSLEAILPYSKTELQKIKMISTMTLAYLIEEKDIAIISTDDSMIIFILLYLKHAIATEDHKWQGLSAKEIVEGLMHLASNDDNKVKIVNEGVLPLLVELLQNGNESEKEASSETVFVLSFSDSNKSKIREENNMMDVLKELSETSGEAAKSAMGALWVLENAETTSKKKKKEGDKSSNDDDNVEDPNSKPRSTAKKRKFSSKHVMISYQWGCQELILRIKERLKKMNYCVWIDVENMKGSILKAMAEAVENSAVVLMCVSPKYKDSPNCRMEAEYAQKCGKPLIPVRVEQAYEPDGWLGLLEGTKMYFDFSKPMSFGEVFINLVKELGDRGKRSSDEVNGPLSTVHASVSNLSPSPVPVANWTKDDVIEWAKENQITTRKIQNFTGKSLAFLQALKCSVPEFYYKYLSENMGLTDFSDLMTFCQGMDKLEA